MAPGIMSLRHNGCGSSSLGDCGYSARRGCRNHARRSAGSVRRGRCAFHRRGTAAVRRLGRRTGRGIVPGLQVPLQTPQLRLDIDRMLVAQLAVFLQSAVDDVFELGRQVRVQPDRRQRRTVHDRVKDHSGSFSAKRHGAGGHFVQHDAKRKQVGTRIERLAAHLLGRHVSHGAQRRSRTGEVLLRVRVLGFSHVRGIRGPGSLRVPPWPAQSRESWRLRAWSQRCSPA